MSLQEGDLITIPVAPGATEREPATIIALVEEEGQELALISTERQSDVGTIGFFIPLEECRPR